MAQPRAQGRYARDPRTATRDARACRLRAQNYTYEQIAKELGFVDRGHARKSVQRGLKDITREPAEELRTVETERLDTLAATTQQVIQESNDHDIILKAIDRHLKIQARRAALLGLDAPQRAEHSGPQGGPIPVDATELSPDQVRRRALQLAEEVARAYE